jgi:hypothetical protein
MAYAAARVLGASLALLTRFWIWKLRARTGGEPRRRRGRGRAEWKEKNEKNRLNSIKTRATGETDARDWDDYDGRENNRRSKSRSQNVKRNLRRHSEGGKSRPRKRRAKKLR